MDLWKFGPINNLIQRYKMALFNWSNQYSVNIKQIDEQHKILIGIINELHDGMKAGRGKEVMGPLINKLVDYTVFHFSFEEKLFTSNGYPEASSHKNTHAALVKKVNELKKDYDSGKAILSMEVMNFLKEWLSGHILGTDKKYSSFLNSKGVV